MTRSLVNNEDEVSLAILMLTFHANGLNDVFQVSGNRMSSCEMKVFDRWGGLVFESLSINVGWDGKDSAGKDLANGIYLYSVVIYDLNDRLWVYNGELNLMR